MPDDLLDNVFGDTLSSPDNFMTLFFGGLQRAQERFESRLQVVDADGNPFDPNAPQITNTRRDAGKE